VRVFETHWRSGGFIVGAREGVGLRVLRCAEGKVLRLSVVRTNLAEHARFRHQVIRVVYVRLRRVGSGAWSWE
jgi:hypothetical protein